MDKKYIVRLSSEERDLLEALVKKGKAAAYQIRHAHVLLKADVDGPNWPDRRIAEAFGCHMRTVVNVRERLVKQGWEAAVGRKKREVPPRKRKLDGAGEARLIALSCSNPPAGQGEWTLQLLAEELVALTVVDEISRQTVWRTLKKTN